MIENVAVAVTDDDLPKANPAFSAPIANPFGLNAAYAPSPSLADIDSDGDLDMFVESYGGGILFYRNTGTAGNPVFAAPVTNAFGLKGTVLRATPSFVDIDGDGDLDAFVGQGGYPGGVQFFLNTGNARSPVFAAPISNAFGLPSGVSGAGIVGTHAFADISDGSLDNRFNNTG